MAENEKNKAQEAEETSRRLELLKKKYDGSEDTDLNSEDIKEAIRLLEKKFAAQMAQMENEKSNPPAETAQPVYYTADGRPVIPVYLPVDSDGNPIFGKPSQPEEEYEEFPNGTKMRIVYQAAEEKGKEEKKEKKKKPDEDYLASMRVVYESPEAIDEEKAEKKEVFAPPPANLPNEEKKAEETPTEDGNSSQDNIFSDNKNVPADEKTSDDFEPLVPVEQKSLEELCGMAKKESRFHRFLRNNIPWKGDSFGEIFRKIVMIIALVTLICCIGYFINIGIEEYQNNKNIDDIGSELNPITGDIEQMWNDIHAKYPDVKFPEGMNPRFADLYVRNPDLVGWLTIKNTKIDFPIVKTSDNEYYLRRSFDKVQTKYGNPFMDSSNHLLPLDRNTVLYGHHMKTGSQVFTDLVKYRDINTFKENPTIQFSTLYADYTWKIYGVYLTNALPSHDNGYVLNYIFTDLKSDESFMNYIKTVDERKLYSTGVDIQPTDKILTLSTCEYDWDEARLVVVARLLRDGESKDVDVSKAAVNENPRYPQIYYDKKGIENPYKNSPKWKPGE